MWVENYSIDYLNLSRLHCSWEHIALWCAKLPRKTCLFALSLLALLLTSCGGSEDRRDRPAPIVTTSTVSDQPFAAILRSETHLQTVNKCPCGAPVTERITQLAFPTAHGSKEQLCGSPKGRRPHPPLVPAHGKQSSTPSGRVNRRRGFATNASQ